MPKQLGCGARDLFQIKRKLEGCFSKIFFAGMKIKTDLNYRDENHI